MRIGQGTDRALGHEQITVGASVESLTPPQGVLLTVLRFLDQPVNWTDGEEADPTSTTGMKQLADEVLVYNSSDPSTFRMIRAADATADADVRVAYYG